MDAGAAGRCSIYLLPGLAVGGAFADVMRGEEVTVWGLPASRLSLVVLPGRHSKWVRLEGGTIRHFATFLSGEIGALLRKDIFPASFRPGRRSRRQVRFTSCIDPELMPIIWNNLPKA